jgi:uncharacterized protein YndB with AHSA1/START domain
MNPMNIPDSIVQEITIKGSAERIFEALTDPGQRITWRGAQGRFQVTHMESDLCFGGPPTSETRGQDPKRSNAAWRP